MVPLRPAAIRARRCSSSRLRRMLASTGRCGEGGFLSGAAGGFTTGGGGIRGGGGGILGFENIHMVAISFV